MLLFSSDGGEMIPQSGRFKLPQTVFKNIYTNKFGFGLWSFSPIFEIPFLQVKKWLDNNWQKKGKKSTFKLIGPETDGVKKKTSPCL